MSSDTYNPKNLDPSLPVLLPEDVEEEAKISKIAFFKESKAKKIVFYIFTILLVGLPLLVELWHPYFKILYRYVKSTQIEADLALITGTDKTLEYIPIKMRNFYFEGVKKLFRFFEYRLYTYCWDEAKAVYKPIQFKLRNTSFAQIHQEMKNGIPSAEIYEQRLTNYGSNSTEIPEKSTLFILITEIFSPFYLFQAFSIIVWASAGEYYVYAGVLFVISISFISSNLIEIRSNYRKLRVKSHYETEVKVYRHYVSTNFQVVSSNTLIPGDIIEISNNWKLPCDVILLQGMCITNESMLTGESVPCVKYQLPNNQKIFNEKEDAQHILFSGTICLETKEDRPNTPVFGMVLKTSFSTAKGRLVRSFLYAKPEDFKFYKDTLKYMIVMGIGAVILFIAGIIGAIDLGLDALYIFVVVFALITTAVPPALPTFLAIGTAIASYRLGKQKIITNSQKKINVAGKIQIMCFDKTGTLTKESLDLKGITPLSNDWKFQPLIKENIHATLDVANSKASSHMLLELMASCHSLTYIRGALSGDPLDVSMFEATGFALKETTELAGGSLKAICSVQAIKGGQYYRSGHEVAVLKRFEFAPQLQRMSVIVKDPLENKQRIYVKGSPEIIKQLCKVSTVPQDFNGVLSQYTQDGFRVIACATKTLNFEGNMDTLERVSLEADLELIGFMIFENKLKEVTPKIITKLTKANIPSIMLTGDNPLTSIFVAKSCEIIPLNKKVVLGVLEQVQGSNAKEIQWKNVGETGRLDTPSDEKLPLRTAKVGDQVQLEMVPSDVRSQDSSSRSKPKKSASFDRNDDNTVIALTGEAFHYLHSKANDDIHSYNKTLNKLKIVARASPEDKAIVVQELQKQGQIVGMCGDGANDCPALKIASVGISLSEAEASLAAHFMSRIPNISCIDILLREGRTALVTSFQCFKYQSLYALIQSLCLVLLVTRGTFFLQLTFLYVDLFLVLPLTITMSFAQSRKKLAKEQPTGSLTSAPVLISMVGQCIIQCIGLVIIYGMVQNQSWYIKPKAFQNIISTDPFNLPADFMNSAIFLTANLQYIATVFAFSVGKPFRKPFYVNWSFTIYLIITTVASLLLIIFATSSTNPLVYLTQASDSFLEPVYDFLDIRGLPENFRWAILIVSVLNAIITVLYEKIGVRFILTYVLKRKNASSI